MVVESFVLAIGNATCYGIREIHNINKMADVILQMSKGAASEEQKAYYIGKLNSNTKKEIKK